MTAESIWDSALRFLTNIGYALLAMASAIVLVVAAMVVLTLLVRLSKRFWPEL